MISFLFRIGSRLLYMVEIVMCLLLLLALEFSLIYLFLYFSPTVLVLVLVGDGLLPHFPALD